MQYIATMFFCLAAAVSLHTQQADTSLSATERKFKRFMEWAHPTPISTGKHILYPPYVLLEQSHSSVFNNSNLVGEESDPLPVQNESSIAVNPTNPKNLIASAVDYRNNSSTWVYVSHDGGRTWENKMLGKPFPDWAASNDPSVGFDMTGRGFLCYGGFNTTTRENGVFIAVTEDEGVTWQPHIPVILHRGTQTRDSVFEDKYYVWLDNSATSPYFKHAYIPWKRVTDADSATQIVLSKSTDGGLSWSVPVPVSARATGTSEDTTFGQSFPLAVTGPNGEVYVVWNYGPKHSIGFSKSTDGGATFSTPKLIQTYKPLGTPLRLNEGVRHTLKGRVRVESYPTLVCDITNGSRRGALYLCWAADSLPDVYFSRSNDGGDTWSTPMHVHSNPANDQFWPWLSIDQTTGDLAVMYLDSRDDIANLAIHCYVSYSNDGGTTWIDRRVSDFQSDVRKNPFQGQNFAGDYSGNAFHGGIIYPSWFDTRNAGADNRDNDVYTAIVDISIPNPVENFRAVILAEQPTELDLSWQAPTTRVFGQPLLPEEFSYALFRNGQFQRVLPSSALQWHDTELTPFERYEYSIAVVAGSDSSVYRTVNSYAGGARLPLAPDIIRWQGTQADYSTKLSVVVPSLRADTLTPFVNASAIRIYRNGVFVREQAIQPQDTGRTVVVYDTTGAQGFFSYSVSVVDNAIPQNESARSNTILAYAGPVAAELSEDFANTVIPPYYNSGKWQQITVLGGRTVVTESPDGNYKGFAADTLVLFPVGVVQENSFLRIRHAAIIDPSDTAYIEVSLDTMATWQRIAFYNNASFAAWQDGTFDQNDFAVEDISLDDMRGKTIFTRLRFRSGVTKHNDGWYIDEIRIGQLSTSVAEYNAGRANLHPNPVSTWLTATFPAGRPLPVEVAVADMTGRQYTVDVRRHGSGIALDATPLAPGIYTATFIDTAGKRTSYLFVVVR